MPIRTGTAQWNGDFKRGDGTLGFGSGAYEGRYSAGTRFEEEPGTNPEELIAAAHAGCFSMALSIELEAAGGKPEQIDTDARVTVEKVGEGFKITKIDLTSRVKAAGLDEATFQQAAEAAKKGCPVSQALAAVENVTLDARLEG